MYMLVTVMGTWKYKFITNMYMLMIVMGTCKYKFVTDMFMYDM